MGLKLTLGNAQFKQPSADSVEVERVKGKSVAFLDLLLVILLLNSDRILYQF